MQCSIRNFPRSWNVRSVDMGIIVGTFDRWSWYYELSNSWSCVKTTSVFQGMRFLRFKSWLRCFSYKVRLYVLTLLCLDGHNPSSIVLCFLIMANIIGFLMCRDDLTDDPRGMTVVSGWWWFATDPRLLDNSIRYGFRLVFVSYMSHLLVELPPGPLKMKVS